MNSEDYTGPTEKLDNVDIKKTPAGWYKKWDAELVAAHKRVKRWHKAGHRIEARYQDRRGSQSDAVRGENTAEHRVNLFHANVKTQKDLMFGNIPKIDVNRSNADAEDDAARVASMMIQRLLTTPVESSGDTTTATLKHCLENRLLPGLGVARIRYEFDSIKENVPEIKGWDKDGNEVTLAEGFEDELITAERAPIEYVHWDDFRWGWARTWEEVPWIAFRTFVKRDAATKRFGKKNVKHMSFNNKSIGYQSEKQLTREETADAWERAEVWEIWDKETRQVFWFHKGIDKILDKKNDLLELEGFWPMPEPMMANTTTSLLLPQPDFILAKDLYNEIDDLQTRIDHITTAVKVVGCYDEGADGVQRIFQEALENQLIPVKNWARLREGGGLEGAIEWVPIQEISQVLERLVDQRDRSMALLYEVTGMAEIVRGGNGPDRETAEVGSKKVQFASVRLQGLQNEFARFASELMKLRAEVISKHFSENTIVHNSNILKTPDSDKVEAALDLIKNWDDAAWRIGIQAESMAQIDYTSRQKDRLEFIEALSMFISQAMGLVELEPGAAPALLQILKWVMAGFRGSKEIEGVLDQAIEAMTQKGEQKQDKPSDEEIKAQAAKEKYAHEEKMEMLKHKNTMEAQKQKAELDVAELRNELMNEIQRLREETNNAMIQENAQADAAIRQDDAETENAKELERLKANGKNKQTSAGSP